MCAWLVKTRRAPSRHSRDERVYGQTTMAVHKLRTPPPPGAILPHQVFHVDADDDIVVGDTIIFTERLYVDMDGNLATGLYTSGDASPPPASQIHAFQDIPMAGSGAAGSAPRVSLSTASLGSHSEWAGGGGGKWATRVDPSGQGVGRPGTAAARIGATRAACAVEFVGERTAAAHVLQDSFRSMRKKEEGGVLEYTRYALD